MTLQKLINCAASNSLELTINYDGEIGMWSVRLHLDEPNPDGLTSINLTHAQDQSLPRAIDRAWASIVEDIVAEIDKVIERQDSR
jgi:hypothetical protein